MVCSPVFEAANDMSRRFSRHRVAYTELPVEMALIAAAGENRVRRVAINIEWYGPARSRLIPALTAYRQSLQHVSPWNYSSDPVRHQIYRVQTDLVAVGTSRSRLPHGYQRDETQNLHYRSGAVTASLDDRYSIRDYRTPVRSILVTVYWKTGPRNFGHSRDIAEIRMC